MDPEGDPQRGVREHAPPNKWAALAVLAAGLSTLVLDGTIVGVSWRTIIADLGLDIGEARWVNSLYSVVLAVLPPTLASFSADFQGRDRAAAFGVWGAGLILAVMVLCTFGSGAARMVILGLIASLRVGSAARPTGKGQRTPRRKPARSSQGP